MNRLKTVPCFGCSGEELRFEDLTASIYANARQFEGTAIYICHGDKQKF